MNKWERSFPEPQLKGHDWVFDVLEDLVSYCEHKELTLLRDELVGLVDRMAPVHGRRQASDGRRGSAG